jgi:hypothetical protein
LADSRRQLPPWRIGIRRADCPVVSREGAKGSAADKTAIADWKTGTWTIVKIGPLGPVNDADQGVEDRGVYNAGFAAHDDNITPPATMNGP